jgi:hypothetical protein
MLLPRLQEPNFRQAGYPTILQIKVSEETRKQMGRKETGGDEQGQESPLDSTPHSHACRTKPTSRMEDKAENTRLGKDEDSDLCVSGHRNSLLPRLGQNKSSGRNAGRRASASRPGMGSRQEKPENPKNSAIYREKNFRSGGWRL